MIKRGFDLFVAVIGLVLLSPLFLILSLFIRIDSPGPLFYRGPRIGKDGVPFKIFKFRTMVVDAHRMGTFLTHDGDPRITGIGRFLRKWKIDEVPQLVNVLRGEMSLVGPRPESPCYVDYYTPEQRRVLEVKPGITGLGQIRFRHEETLLSRCEDREKDYIEKIMPQKVAIDLEYVEKRSFLVDLGVILDTFLCLFAEDEAQSLPDALPSVPTFPGTPAGEI